MNISNHQLLRVESIFSFTLLLHRFITIGSSNILLAVWNITAHVSLVCSHIYFFAACHFLWRQIFHSHWTHRSRQNRIDSWKRRRKINWTISLISFLRLALKRNTKSFSIELIQFFICCASRKLCSFLFISQVTAQANRTSVRDTSLRFYFTSIDSRVSKLNSNVELSVWS